MSQGKTEKIQVEGVRCFLFAMSSGERYSVIFNANKSKCILFLSCYKPARLFSVVNPLFYIGGNVIQHVNEWPHLGAHYIG